MQSKEALLTAALIGKRLNDNLDAFKQHVPDVYELFSDYVEKELYLIYGNDGQVNLFDRKNGHVLYDGDPVGLLMEHLDSYIESPVYRPYVLGGNMDPDFEKIIPVHHDAMVSMGRLQANSLGRLLSEKIVLRKKDVDGSVSLVGGRLPSFLNSLFVFSTGLGFDLEKLYFDFDIKRLILIESNLDSFYASLQLIDWKGIIDKSIERGFSIHFFLSEDMDTITDDVSGFLSRSGRHNVAGCYMYSPFYMEKYKELYSNFKENLDLSIFAGFGFYDDSRMSVAHSVNNFKNGVPCIKSDRNINKLFGQKDVPAFIVGSGPSLDCDIEFIKNNKDKVVIISCGSSLKALYVNGIKPDFHVELERTAHVLHWIKSSSEDEGFRRYLKDICLIAASQVHPDVFDLFKWGGQIPKDTETGSLLLYRVLGHKGAPLVSRVAPTCVHTGFTVAVLLGFAKIYLFGVDMGYKTYSNHHSKHSLYEELSDEMAEKLVPSNATEVEVEANFDGEKVFASGYFPLFRHTLSSVIVAWVETFERRLEVFNCSDGAKIRGASPLRSNELDLSHFAIIDNKNELVDNIYKSHFSFVPSESDYEELVSFLESSYEKVSKMSFWLCSKIDNTSINSIEDALSLVDELSFGFHSNIDDIGISEEDSWLYSLYDGSMLYALSAIQSTVCMPIDEDVRLKIFNDMLLVLKGLFVDLECDFIKNSLVNDKEEYYDFF